MLNGPCHATSSRVVLEGEPPVEMVVAVPDIAPSVGIVQVVDILSVRPLYDELCCAMASRGYAVAAVEPFMRIPGDVRDPLGIPERRELIRDLTDADELGALARAGEYLREHHGVYDLVVVGFCLGGYYALKAAATGDYVGAVSCYGMITTPESWMAPGHIDPMNTIGNVCPTLAAFGGRDEWTPPDQINGLREALADRDDCSVIVYEDADHGFVHSPTSPNHRADDAASFWTTCLDFIEGVAPQQS